MSMHSDRVKWALNHLEGFSREATDYLREEITRQDKAMRDMLEKGNFGCACCVYRKQEDCEDKCTEGRRAYFMGEKGK